MKRLAAFCIILFIGATAFAQNAAGPGPSSEQDYMLYCMGCHQRNGAGLGVSVPPLVGVDRFMRSPEGREYVVRVPGVANSGLSDERLTALLNWTLAEFGSSEFEPYTANEVAPLRANPFMNAVEARDALMSTFDETVGGNAGAKAPEFRRPDSKAGVSYTY